MKNRAEKWCAYIRRAEIASSNLAILFIVLNAPRIAALQHTAEEQDGPLDVILSAVMFLGRS